MKITFEIGDRIEMTHIKSAMGLKLSEKKYGSQVLDYDGGQMVKVAMPIYENRVVFKNEQLHRFFPASYTSEQMRREILEILKLWMKNNWDK